MFIGSVNECYLLTTVCSVNPGYRGLFGKVQSGLVGTFREFKVNPGYRGLFRTNQRLIRCNPGYQSYLDQHLFPKDFGLDSFHVHCI